MKLSVLSDIHLEFDQIPSIWNKITRCDSDVMVIAGDFSGHKTIFKDLVDLYDDYKKPIIMVVGNHEYYGTSRKSLDQRFKEFSEIYPDIHILTEDNVVIDGVLFIGSTGWFDGSNGPVNMACKHGLNDFKYIYDLIDADYGIDWGKTSRKHFETSLLRNVYNGTYDKVVCVSHHMPSKSCIAPQYYSSPLNAVFANDWNDLIEIYQPDLFISGHTHTSYDFNIGKTRLVCNPQGYPSVSQRMVNGQLEETWYIENPKFNPSLVIEI